MATPKEIKNRISSVSNTRKITKTMELVSTAKSKKAVSRVGTAQPYSRKLLQFAGSLTASGVEISHPLLRNPKPEERKKSIVLVVTSNRGLCGGFNNNVIKLAVDFTKEAEKSGREIRTFIIGKKAFNFFKFKKLAYEKFLQEFDDSVPFDQAKNLADFFMDEFSQGNVDSIEVFYTRYYNAVVQKPYHRTLLPLDAEPEKSDGRKSQTQVEEASRDAGVTILEPGPEEIMKALLPKIVRVNLFSLLLESAAGEHIARRIAMKNATDAADDMIRNMTLLYNRARQAKITQEIAEIVAGSDAL